MEDNEEEDEEEGGAWRLHVEVGKLRKVTIFIAMRIIESADEEEDCNPGDAWTCSSYSTQATDFIRTLLFVKLSFVVLRNS